MSRIFISHSSANSAAALALASWLESNGWSDYFLDIDDSRGINPGERWMSALVQAVDRCEAVILLVSPAWRDSKYCFAEFFQAKKLGKRIFGVIVERVALSELPEQMTAEWQICDLTGTHDSLSFTVARVPAVTETVVSFPRAGLEALARGLKRAGLDASTFVWPPEGQPDRSPYPGLRALQEVDAAVFFGRESSIVRAIDQMRVLRERGIEHLFVVLAASGAGKSSFLRAGLLPRLRRDTRHFHVLPTIRPERAAMSGDQGLLNCLKGALETARQPMSHAQIRAELSSIGLSGVLSRIVTAIQGVQEPTLIVPVDQAEELFASDGDDEARQFLLHLEASRQHLPSDKAAGDRERRLRVLFVMTIRSDSLPKLQAERAIRALSPVLFSLPTMPASEFRSVIEGPARRQTESVKPLVITPQLAEQLVEDSQGADALPLLALTLQWLYREFTTAEGTRVGCGEYQQLGGVRGVISMAVRRAFESPGTEPTIPADKHEQERLLKQLFPYIATVDPDTGSWKRRVASREILSSKVPQVDALVSRLVEQRLLLSDFRHVAEGREPVEVVEVAHESLLRQWDNLDHWLRELAADLSAFESLRRSANDWHRSGRDEALLVHTAHRLRAAESLMTDARLDVRFEAIDREYLAACSQRDQRERQEREDQLRRIAEQQAARAALQRRVTWGLSSAAVLLLGLSAWTVMQNREVSLQSSLILTHAAGVAFDQGRFDQSLRLGVLAARTSWLRPAHADAARELARAAEFSTLRARLDGHIKAVESAAFSPDGRQVVTASWDSTARVWDAATGLPLAEPMKHGGAVFSASFSPDGKRVVTASEDSTARVWDVATGRPVAEPMKHGGRVYSAKFNLDATRVVTASEDSTARVWDADTGKPLGEPMTHRYGVASASFSHDGKRVVTASLDSTARIWDADTGQPMSQPMEHDGVVRSASFSLDGKRVVTASHDRTARIWDAVTGKPLAEPMIHRKLILSASFSRDGKRVVTASSDFTARVWHADRGTPLGEAMKHEGVVRFAAFSPDGKRVITTSEDNTARIWDAETGIPVAEPMRHDNAVLFASFSPDGKRLVTASSDSTARVWDGDLGKPAVETMKQGDRVFYSASFSPDGSRVVTASLNSTARIWDARTGKPMTEPMIHEGRVNSASFSPDGKRVITTSEKDMTARIWDAGGKPLLPMEIDHGGVRLASFSPDGKRVVTASMDRTVRVWDAATGTPLSHPMVHEARVTFAGFSPDGRRVVTASSGARLWDADTGKPLGEPMTHAEGLHSASFSPDGKRVVTASRDSTARVWDAVTGKPVAAPMVHADGVKSASFSPDGKRVVTASLDTTARVWDAETGTPVAVMTHKGGVHSASFSPDSKWVVTLSSDLSDYTARVWDADSGKALAEPMTQVFSASFSPDGKRVVTAAYGTAGIWDLFWPSLTRTDHLIAEVCRRKLIGRLRRITEADVRMARILPPKWAGEDVCLGFDTLPN